MKKYYTSAYSNFGIGLLKLQILYWVGFSSRTFIALCCKCCSEPCFTPGSPQWIVSFNVFLIAYCLQMIHVTDRVCLSLKSKRTRS